MLVYEFQTEELESLLKLFLTFTDLYSFDKMDDNLNDPLNHFAQSLFKAYRTSFDTELEFKKSLKKIFYEQK